MKLSSRNAAIYKLTDYVVRQLIIFIAYYYIIPQWAMDSRISLFIHSVLNLLDEHCLPFSLITKSFPNPVG